MISKHCDSCYFGSVCSDDNICKDYTPLGEQSEDEVIYDLIEQRRSEFYNEWNQYISEWNT